MNVVKLPTANDRFDAKAAECAVTIAKSLELASLMYGDAAMMAGLYTNMAMALRRMPAGTRSVCLWKLAKDAAQ